ncbi:MAG: quinone oxidoreductase family protein [Candidatus Hodarchaeales archaeon]|jgi:NADPH2:quinone reductase
MKAVVLNKLGGPEVLRTIDIPKPSQPDSNEVIIQLKAAGVNFAETMARRGIYGWVPKKKGFILGLEGTGIIESVGRDVLNFSSGDNVIVIGQSGCYAEFIKISEKQVFPMLDSFNYIENAAFSASYLTAFIALQEMARVRKKETILVQAAAGSLGTATVQLAREFGLKIAGTCSHPKKVKFLIKKLGIDLAINYTTENFVKQVKNWTDEKGVDVVLESVGGKIFRQSLSCLAPLGRIVVVGVSSLRFDKKNPLTWWSAWNALPRINLPRMLGNSQGVLAFHVGRLMESSFEQLSRAYSAVRRLIEKSDIQPIVDKVYPLEKAAEAHQRIESRQNIGKVVLKI